MNEIVSLFKQQIKVAEAYNITVSTMNIEIADGWSVQLTIRRNNDSTAEK